MPAFEDKLPTHCPRCGRGKVRRIVYGMPGPEMEVDAAAGEIVLGGCMVGPQRWDCRSCSYQWPLSPEVLEEFPVYDALDLAYCAYEEHVDEAIEVGQLLHEAGYDARIVAAGILHGVIERAGLTGGEIADVAGAPVAGLVEAVTADARIADPTRRFLDRRVRIAYIGPRALAVYAAALLVELRFLRREYAVWGERLSGLLTMSLDEKVTETRRDLRLILGRRDEIPLVADVETELAGLERDRAEHRRSCKVKGDSPSRAVEGPGPKTPQQPAAEAPRRKGPASRKGC